jgi:hypothetical protein
MSFRKTDSRSSRPARHRMSLALVAAGALTALAVSSAVGLAASTRSASAVGQAPPEWVANADSWPAHNYDLANTRATTRTAINSTNVSALKVSGAFR